MKNEKDEQKEKSLTSICVIRSKQIIQMRKAYLILSEANVEVLKCTKRFPTEDKIKELLIEIKNSIIELQMGIATLLKPVYAMYNITWSHKLWFTMNEMRDGYILLRRLNSLGATHVLFLREHIDSFDGSIVKEGEIKEYKDVNHFLQRIDADNTLRKLKSKSN